MRNAYITVKLFDDYAEFWDVEYTEIRVKEEKWLVQYYDGEWRTIAKYSPSLTTVTNSSGVFVTQSFALGFPIASDGALKITYVVKEARPLKHLITLTNKGDAPYEFRLVQMWNGIDANVVKYDRGTLEVISTVNIYSLWFRFSSEANGFVVAEDLQSTGYCDASGTYRNDVLQPATIGIGPTGLTAAFTYSSSSLYALEPGENLSLDPDTWTGDGEWGLSGSIVHEGMVWVEPWGPMESETAYVGSSIEVGKCKWLPPREVWYQLWRGYVSFKTGSEPGIDRIPNNAIIDEANLYLYLLWNDCRGEGGWIGTGFEVWLYSGKDQWTELTTGCWDRCDSYDYSMYISADTMDNIYYRMDVNPASIAYSGQLRTQFRLKHYYEWYAPEGYTAVQLCCFDNPMDPQYGNSPQLEVIYHF